MRGGPVEIIYEDFKEAVLRCANELINCFEKYNKNSEVDKDFQNFKKLCDETKDRMAKSGENK